MFISLKDGIQEKYQDLQNLFLLPKKNILLNLFQGNKKKNTNNSDKFLKEISKSL